MANIVGTEGVETLVGTPDGDDFRLEGGTDTIIGNGGIDTVDLSDDSSTAVNVNLMTGAMTGWGSATLQGITQIVGGFGGGVLTGGASTTYIHAQGGDTTINVGPISTTVVLGYGGNDTVNGGAGNDGIYVLTGNNTIDGGGGFNGVSYAAIKTGYVTVDLYAGAWHPGGYDSLKNVTNIQGGDGGNTLRGDYQNNIIVGGAGNDIIEGRQGNDTLTGGGGGDLFVMDTGTGNTVITDFVHGQDQIDLTSYGLQSLAAIQAIAIRAGGDTVLNLPAVGSAPAGTLTLTGVGSISASDFADLGTATLTYPNQIKTANFSGSLGQYSVSVSSDSTAAVNTATVTDNVAGRDGTTVLSSVQQAHFTDDTLVFDLHSSQDLLVYELYQAAYGRVPDNAGFRYWANTADSTNMGALTIADQFLGAPEFTQLYGASPSNQQYVTELYQHVLGRAPDQAGLDYWVGQANAGMAKDALLVNFAISQENVQMIGSHVAAGYWTT